MNSGIYLKNLPANRNFKNKDALLQEYVKRKKKDKGKRKEKEKKERKALALLSSPHPANYKEIWKCMVGKMSHHNPVFAYRSFS